MVKISAYNYFRQLFCQSGEFIVCADSKLNIVYATGNVHPIFSIDDKPLLNLGCILSIRDCDTVKSALCDTPHSVSFDFISITENVPRKCVVIPMEFDSAYYFVLYISNTKARAIEKLQQQDIETIVSSTMKKFGDYCAPLLQYADTLDDVGRQTITASMLKIVKLLKNIEAVTMGNCISRQNRVIDLCGYMERLLCKIQRRLGQDKFGYTVLPANSVCLTETSTDALDLMAVNIITEVFRVCNKNAHIYVRVSGDRENNYIIISSDANGMRYTPDELIKQNDSEHADNDEHYAASRTVCKKVARDIGAKAFFTKTFGGGVTHGLMLKRARPRHTTLYDNLEDYNDNFELLDILLSDI